MASSGNGPLALIDVKQLTLSDVESGFDLTRANDINWGQFRAPLKIVDDHQSTANGLDDRLLLSLGILLIAVHTTSPDPNSPSSPPIPITSQSRFTFWPFVFQGVKCSLRGFPGYSLWYGPDPRVDMAVNLIIVETMQGLSAAGIPECLAYMGMVHKQHQYEDKTSRPVGLSSDHDQFHFLMISGEGNWSQMDYNYASHTQEIVDTLAFFHKEASILSASCGSGISDTHALPAHIRSTSEKPWSIFQVTGDIDNMDEKESD
ncbi:uncharacterized protein N7479_009374 [Penicillium vulpinum]|uniref:Uncharacterized protein n=1 Tax=Penicillium vulpinum TaxID=29845 RepID=A0A1V6RU43_9EURO|nr:uncharacterized protein N7479_009374 [Penicillium vulpinum]KAJ5950961.1 hypothetical protein N7479_009374 [Penicillium vulpinum]OQE05292.1 hypothetical protein PENVUL_c025G05053 [Penicillium vulpinum]